MSSGPLPEYLEGYAIAGQNLFGEAACKFLDIRVHCSLSNDSSLPAALR